ncbi:hypothetical protein EI94DRAFT_1745424 [Lactarius quietus]|nr:hypothetical protein EI94DRAFT_1745424 [Lactarius quietus]
MGAHNPGRRREPMNHPSLPQSPGGFLVQGKDHPVRPSAKSEAPDLWDQRLPEWWTYYLANFYDQEPETASIISDATNPRTEWPQSIEAQTASQGSPILEQNQNPENTPLHLAFGVFDGSFGNQAGAMPGCHTYAEYSQHIQEEDIQLTGRQLTDRGIDSSLVSGSNVQLGHPRNANTFPSDVCPSQVPQQQWEELEEARKYPDMAIPCPSESKSETRRKAPRGLHRCTSSSCNKAYQRRQDLKRHTIDKHIRHRKCPFCHTEWSRPERIKVHLLEQHRSLLTEDQQQEIRTLRGRDNTIRFLEKYANTNLHTL